MKTNLPATYDREAAIALLKRLNGLTAGDVLDAVRRRIEGTGIPASISVIRQAFADALARVATNARAAQTKQQDAQGTPDEDRDAATQESNKSDGK